MAATKYTYSISTDFPNQKVDAYKLTVEIRESSITTAVDYINTSGDDCDIWFKDELSAGDATALLPAVIAAHDGEPIPDTPAPVMDDGRPIVRADSRPFNTSTIYTMGGDDSTGFGTGVQMVWDFANDDDIVTGDHVPSGMKCKEILVKYNCPIYPKDGCLYFFDAPWGQYICMDIVVPKNTYYPNPVGSIPASALGLSGTQMYAFSGNSRVTFQAYVVRHRMYGSCPMGDELNAEGSAIAPIPVGWYMRGRIYTPTSDNISKGYGSVEMHRCHTVLLPGMTMQDVFNAH